MQPPASSVGYLRCTHMDITTAGLALAEKMESSSLVLVCVLVTCSAWMVQGKCVAIDDHQDQNEVEVSAEAKLPGVCKVCKWALKKVKQITGNNATAEEIMSKLLSICNKIPSSRLKSSCQKLVKGHVNMLIEELKTIDDVRTICVQIKACKPKELELMEEHYLKYAAELFSGNDVEE